MSRLNFGGPESPRQGCNLAGAQPPPVTRPEPAKPNWTERGPAQFSNRVADGFEHAPHLPVAALPDDQPDLGQPTCAPRGVPTKPGSWAGNQLDLSRKRPPIVEQNPLAQRAQVLPTGYALHDRQVLLGHLVARVCKAVRQHAVVGQQKQTARGGIEPADREQAGWARSSDQVEDRRPALRISSGHEHPKGLVQGQ